MPVDLIRGRAPLGPFSLHKPSHAFLFLFPVLFLAVNAILYLTAQDWYRREIAAEDRLLENTQAVCFAVAGVMAIVTGVRLRNMERTILALPYGLIAAGMLFGCLEEISWGQRLFHYATPEFMRIRSVQAETNFHNLQGVHQSLGYMGFVLSTIASFAWLLPDALLRRRGGFLAFVVPPPICMLYFLQNGVFAAFLVTQGYFVDKPILKVGYQELFETPFAMGFIVFLGWNLWRLTAVQRELQPASVAESASQPG